jgi:hypothetical protein
LNTPVAGTANTGGGGGACLNNDGAAGGSGFVAIRYLTSDFSGLTVTGGTITTDGSYTIHTFNTSDTFLVSAGGMTNTPIPTLALMGVG